MFYADAIYYYINNTLHTYTIRPQATGTHYLGSSELRWNNIFSNLGNFSGIVTMSSRLRMVGTTATPAWDSAGAITWTESTSDSQPVSLVYTSYDSYRSPAGLKLMGNQGGEWFEVVGNIYGAGFVKSSSSDSYVLLGGGGHKTISDFMLKSDELTNNLTTITKTLTVTKDWMDTGIKYTDLDTGTYAIQVYSHTTGNLIWYGYWSGIMTWYGSTTNSSDSDEILLHRGAHTSNGNTIYLRTINTTETDGRHMRLQIAANKNWSSATFTFNFKKLI